MVLIYLSYETPFNPVDFSPDSGLWRAAIHKHREERRVVLSHFKEALLGIWNILQGMFAHTGGTGGAMDPVCLTALSEPKSRYEISMGGNADILIPKKLYRFQTATA
jgi:hypothetical protein